MAVERIVEVRISGTRAARGAAPKCVPSASLAHATPRHHARHRGWGRGRSAMDARTRSTRNWKRKRRTRCLRRAQRQLGHRKDRSWPMHTARATGPGWTSSCAYAAHKAWPSPAECATLTAARVYTVLHARRWDGAGVAGHLVQRPAPRKDWGCRANRCGKVVAHAGTFPDPRAGQWPHRHRRRGLGATGTARPAFAASCDPAGPDSLFRWGCQLASCAPPPPRDAWPHWTGTVLA